MTFDLESGIVNCSGYFVEMTSVGKSEQGECNLC